MSTLEGTAPEMAVYGALKKLKIPFIFQSSQLGGRQTSGGAVLDFRISYLNLGINVQSFYWHYSNPERVAQDKLLRIALEGQGIIVIYIDEEDALRDADYYVEEALKYNDHSMMRDM